MLTIFDMEIVMLIWLFVVVFMIHNFEEIILIERWFNRTYPIVKHRIPSFALSDIEKMKTITAAQFTFSILILFVSTIFLIYMTFLTNNLAYFLGMNIFFGLNIFIHPNQSLLLKSYVPGLITTILCIIPYNIYLFYTLFNNGLLSTSLMLTSLIVTVLLIPIFLLSHTFSVRLVKS